MLKKSDNNIQLNEHRIEKKQITTYISHLNTQYNQIMVEEEKNDADHTTKIHLKFVNPSEDEQKKILHNS